MSTETTNEKKKNPFVMFPDNITDDQRVVRLKRKGGFEYVGLYFHLCFILHRYREDNLEASMPFDMNDPEAFDDLVYQLHPMEAGRIREAIELMITTGLLEVFEHDGVQYICAPVMRDAVLNIKRQSQLQSDRRRGKSRNDPEEAQGDDLRDNSQMTITELQNCAQRFTKIAVDLTSINRFYDEVVKNSAGVINPENVENYFIEWKEHS